MIFEVDNQTLKDLEIFKTIQKSSCVFDYFNFAKSVGGKTKLEKMFKSPFTEAKKIKERAEVILFFSKTDVSDFDIDKNDLDFIEHYLNYGERPTDLPSKFSTIEKSIIQKFVGQSNDQYIIERGIDYTILVFNNLFKFFFALEDANIPNYLFQIKEKLSILYKNPEYSCIIYKSPLEKLKAIEIAKLDHMLRHTHNLDTRFFLDTMYELDALIGISLAMNKFDLTIPQIEEDRGIIKIKGLYHLNVKNGVPNDIEFSENSNMAFISGPNMAGKSTFLKATGIAVFLAHCGFPVPAKHMIFSPSFGMYTSINLVDSLSLEESHFFSEVQRIKYVATRLQEKKKMLVIFDELFRGTNVKDAYDGSLAVIKAFAKIRTSFFAISTHIVEVTKELLKIDNIQFKFLEVYNTNGSYSYSYKLQNGISEDRLGMYIIEKEKLIEIIESCSSEEI